MDAVGALELAIAGPLALAVKSCAGMAAAVNGTGDDNEKRSLHGRPLC
jgi:hypothetical protein